MAWNGSGTFVLNPSYSPEVDGTTIEAARYNGLTTDIAAGITNAIAKDGQNTPTANLPMGNRKHTGLAAGSAAGDSVRYEQANVIGETTVTGHATLADIFAAATARVLFDGTGLTVTAIPASSLNTWKIVRFNGVNTLTNSASLVLSGGGDITTAAGDYALFVSVGSTTVVADYFAAAGPSIRLNTVIAAVGANTIANGDYAQKWDWSLSTASKIGFRVSESSASSGSGSSLFAVDNASGSLARPFISQWTGSANGLLGWSTGGGILAQAPTLTGVAGPDVTILAGGAGTTTANGGNVNITAGASGTTSGTPGDVNITAGAGATGTFIGGSIELIPGNSTAADAGAVVINGGPLVFEGSNAPTASSGGGTISGTDSAFTLTWPLGGSGPGGTITFSRNMGTAGSVPVVVATYSEASITINLTATPTGITYTLRDSAGAGYTPGVGGYASFIVIPKARGL